MAAPIVTETLLLANPRIRADTIRMQLEQQLIQQYGYNQQYIVSVYCWYKGRGRSANNRPQHFDLHNVSVIKAETTFESRNAAESSVFIVVCWDNPCQFESQILLTLITKSLAHYSLISSTPIWLLIASAARHPLPRTSYNTHFSQSGTTQTTNQNVVNGVPPPPLHLTLASSFCTSIINKSHFSIHQWPTYSRSAA